MKGTVICDGRGNAGTGACAAVLILHGDDRNKIVGEVEEAKQIDPTTNIVAEHMSIQLGIEIAKVAGVTDLLVLNDSQTPVNHVNGTYQVKQPHLKPLVEKTWEMASDFEKIEIRWVPREETLRADRLCREVDKKKSNARRKRPGGPLPSKSEKRLNPFLRTAAGREEYQELVRQGIQTEEGACECDLGLRPRQNCWDCSGPVKKA